MRLDTYVNYRGNCEQAFRFYERHLGGRITGILRHREQPNPNIQADWQEKVLHARMEIGTSVLMGADVPTAEPMRSAYLTLTLDREEDAEVQANASLHEGACFVRIARDGRETEKELSRPCLELGHRRHRRGRRRTGAPADEAL